MTKYLPYIIIFVLGFITAYFIKRDTTIQTKIESVTDTLYVAKTDTIVEYKPKYINKVVLDTIKLVVNTKDTIYLPKEQKYYAKDSLYQCWISGYEPSLDSIRVFNKVEYRTITNTTTQTIYKNKWSLYGYLGFNMYQTKVIPTFDLMFNTSFNMSFGANIGLLQNKPMYGLKIGYKLK